MDYNHVMNVVANVFKQDFEDAYEQLDPRGKAKLLRYYFSFYRRWLSSALVNNTFLTPANIIALTNQEYHKKNLTTTVPTVKTFRSFKKFTFHELSYSLDSHPAVYDLQQFVTYLAPSFTVTTVDNRNFSTLCLPPDGYLDETRELELMQLVSIQDPFYIAYLFRIALELGLIAKMPSLYSTQMQVTPRFNELFAKKLTKKKSREILGEIVTASVKLATDTINTFFLTFDTIDTDFILQSITKPTGIDEMFNYIYNKLDVDFRSISDIDPDKPMPEEYHEIMSSAFSLGAIISMHITTVFGAYLQLINPIYSGTHSMERDMAFVQDALATNNDIEIPLFMPCTFFIPTELGLKFFKLPPESTFPLPTMPEFEQLIDALENIDKVRLAMKQQPDEQDNIPISELLVYEFRVKLNVAPSFWKRAAFVGDMTLDEFAAFISYEFFGSFTNDYSFHTTNSVNRFTEISSSKRKLGEKNSETTTIEEFLQTSAQEFLLIIRDKGLSAKMAEHTGNKYKHNEPIKLAVTCISGKETFHKNFYPRITGEGKAFNKL